MWPKQVDWKQLKFGVEIEFAGGRPTEIEVLPGWFMDLNERVIDDNGSESGSELKPPPLQWNDREQIGVMLSRLREQADGPYANWNCGLHVHVGLEPWGEDIVLPMVEAALHMQHALRALLNTSDWRLQFCPPLTETMLDHYRSTPSREALRHHGRPQSHRCGINLGAWYDIGTVEIRYANGSLNTEEVLNTIELCLRFVAAIGEGKQLPPTEDPAVLAKVLGVAADGYPPLRPAPQWYRERLWLEDALLPILAPQTEALVPNSEILSIIPVPEGVRVVVERYEGTTLPLIFAPTAEGWKLLT